VKESASTQNDFFSALVSVDKRDLLPFIHDFYGKRTPTFQPHQDVRQLALIELPGTEYWALPLQYGDLVEMIRRARAAEQQRELWSEVMEAAKQRLLDYGRDPGNAYANARFLDLRVGDGKRRVTTEAEAQEACAAWVDKFDAELDRKSVDRTRLKPRQLATLSVVHAMLRKPRKVRSKNGLGRWCFGIGTYIPGADIERGDWMHRKLASQCLPRHCDASAAAAEDRANGRGRAIAAAPVTCELCHKGFSGYDTLAKHCRREHGNYAEYRKRVFHKGKDAGQVELQPWVK
jgi:hypothetical protein